MLAPPVEVEGVNPILALAFEAVATGALGALGIVMGVTETESMEAGLIPKAL